MNPITILLTGAGAPGAPSIIKCLRKNGEREIKIIGVDMNEMAAGRKLVNSFYQVPAAGDPAFIQKIIEICEREKVQIVVPLVTRELYIFSSSLPEFLSRGIQVSVMQDSVLRRVNNKASLLTEMRDMGMKTPGFVVAHSVQEIEKACAELGYPENPLCIKGAEGNGSRGVRIIDEKKSYYDLLFNEKPNSMYMSYHDLIAALKEKLVIPEMLVMEYLPGEEYGVDALCNNGEVLYIAGRYNSSVTSSIPQASIVQNRPEPIDISSELIRKMKMDGNVNFDFKYDRNGFPMLMEINPRLSATITAYAPAGINFPYLRLKQLLGEQLPICRLHEGIKMQRRYSEVFFTDEDVEMVW